MRLVGKKRCFPVVGFLIAFNRSFFPFCPLVSCFFSSMFPAEPPLFLGSTNTSERVCVRVRRLQTETVDRFSRSTVGTIPLIIHLPKRPNSHYRAGPNNFEHSRAQEEEAIFKPRSPTLKFRILHEENTLRLVLSHMDMHTCGRGFFGFW